MSDYADVIAAARRRTLAKDDQRYQKLKEHAKAGVAEAQNALREIDDAGGAHNGSVNRII